MKISLDDLNFKKIRDLIYDESGISFNDRNRSVLESRLNERLKQTQKDSIEEYYSFISQDKTELKNLLDSVTTNLTRFFRNQLHFEAFENFVITDLMEKKKDRKIKLWSAGCSTGEEPYSLAMVLKDKLDSSWDIKIIASDISFNVLMKAKEGFYTKDKVDGIPKKYLEKYLVQIGEGYYIKDEIKDIIQFDYHNLKNTPAFSGFDIVFCRNVIIYFDSVAQERAINQFYNLMNDYAYLFIGHSESLFGMKTDFVFTKTGSACVYMKNKEK